MEDTQLLTVKAVAQQLALSERSVWELIAHGAIPSLRLGRSRRVAVASLRRYVEEQEKSEMQPA